VTKQTPTYFMLQALLAALLFGASAPLSKLLLGQVEPIALAAFLYLGCGISLSLLKLVRPKDYAAEAPSPVRALCGTGQGRGGGLSPYRRGNSIHFSGALRLRKP